MVWFKNQADQSTSTTNQSANNNVNQNTNSSANTNQSVSNTNTSTTCTVKDDCRVACASVACATGTQGGWECQENYCRCECVEIGPEDGASLTELFNGPVSIECSQDNDCTLADRTLDYSGCYPGYCDTIDYSLEKYVAVNNEDYLQLRNSVAPAEDSCGPAPGCPTAYRNTNYRARCVKQLCQKVSD